MNAKEFPFRFGTLVKGDLFFDRSDEARRLHDEVAGGQNVLLYAPRRYGKSSLAARVAETWEREGFVCLAFDLMRAESLDDFLRAYANEVLAAEDRASGNLRALLGALSSLRPRLTVGDDGKPSLELDFGRGGPTARSLEEVLALPEKFASKKRRFIVVFDEFQEVVALSRRVPAERIFRSVIQRQEFVRYVFLGSKTHLLRRMFNDRARPFYNSASSIVLGKPPERESRAFLQARFRAGGMELPKETEDAILAASENIPYYLQAVALRTWDEARRRRARAPTLRDAEAGLATLEGERREVYEALAASLGDSHRRLLSALAREPTARFDADYRARHFLPGTTTLSSAVKKLTDDGLLERDDAGTLRIADPLHARYLRRGMALRLELES